jgi:hypothetical protein
VYENSFLNSVPQGRLNLAQDASPGLRHATCLSPAGTAEGCPGLHRGLFFSRPCGTGSSLLFNPGLASWAKFGRPYGTEFRSEFSHPILNPRGTSSLIVRSAQLLRGCSKGRSRPGGFEKRTSAVKRAGHLRHGWKPCPSSKLCYPLFDSCQGGGTSSAHCVAQQNRQHRDGVFGVQHSFTFLRRMRMQCGGRDARRVCHRRADQI